MKLKFGLTTAAKNEDVNLLQRMQQKGVDLSEKAEHVQNWQKQQYALTKHWAVVEDGEQVGCDTVQSECHDLMVERHFQLFEDDDCTGKKAEVQSSAENDNSIETVLGWWWVGLDALQRKFKCSDEEDFLFAQDRICIF